jgi:acyl-CoA reductase-like NAD-dependent aldehyde dehydrogenase
MEWIDEAVKGGAVVHCGNKREGNVIWPTVLTNVNSDMKVIKGEVFGPVVSVIPFDTIDEAIGMVNDSQFGLNAGILTTNISVAMEAIPKIKTGGVIVGGTCSFRFGNMPYGGVKDSGIGREAPKYAIEEMTELKTVVIL